MILWKEKKVCSTENSELLLMYEIVWTKSAFISLDDMNIPLQ